MVLVRTVLRRDLPNGSVRRGRVPVGTRAGAAAAAAANGLGVLLRLVPDVLGGTGGRLLDVLRGALRLLLHGLGGVLRLVLDLLGSLLSLLLHVRADVLGHLLRLVDDALVLGRFDRTASRALLGLAGRQDRRDEPAD